MEAPAKNGQDGKGAIGEKKIPESLEPDDDKFEGVLALKATGFRGDGERATGGEGRKKLAIRLNGAKRGAKAERLAGQLGRTAVADPQNDDARGKPGRVAPERVSLGVVIEVHAKIDMRDDGKASRGRRFFDGRNLGEGLSKSLANLARVGGVARTGAARLELGGRGGQAGGRWAVTVAQSTKFINSSI